MIRKGPSGVKSHFKIPLGVKRSVGILKKPKQSNIVGHTKTNKIAGKKQKYP